MKFICNEKQFDWDRATALYEIKIEHEFLVSEEEAHDGLLQIKVLAAIQEIKEYLNSLDVNLKPIKRLKDPMIIDGEWENEVPE